ncbi:hypothetical protein GCM10023063_18890 [Arthrobacter methylotrophus]|uniref:DUF3043 domain-containing protein n=1 Tax=Arthrobacter methylotrophus TaxID=121291 RepID=A0ABV5UP60_9MICC
MGFWDAEETGAERAARIKGENQAAEHARRQASKEEEREHKQQERWDAENLRYQRAEYEADLAAWKKNPAEYERRYSSPFDVPEMPGNPIYDQIRARSQREQARAQAQPRDEPMPAFLKVGLVVLGVIFILPALLQAIMPTVGHVLQIIWLIVLSLAGLLTAVWLVLKLTAGDDPVKLRRAQLVNPVRIGTIIYQVVREHLAERRARKNAE